MNHLPVPLDGQHVRVPFHSDRKVFKPDDFFKIPGRYLCRETDHGHRCGMGNVDRLIEVGLCRNMERNRVHAFLQDWLWFSLLACVTNQEIDSNEFYDQHGHCVETNPILNKKLQKWIEEEERRSAPLRVSSADKCSYPEPQSLRALSALQCAQKFILKHLSYSARDADGHHHTNPSGAEPEEHWVFSLVDSELSLSIAILGQTLQRERKWASAFDESSHGHQLEELSNWGSSVYCRKMMMDNQWCPAEIRRVESTMGGPCEVYYASSCNREDGDRDDHGGCTMWHKRCKSLGRAEPSAPHMKACPMGSCQALAVDDHEKQVSDILDRGLTPLVTFKPGSGGLLIMGYDLRANSPPVHFGALSHSWGDSLVDAGRDSRDSNDRTMLRCQLQQLQQSFNKALGGKGEQEYIPFWIDVLCLPRQEESKRLALEQMHNIFKKAGGVIVWDKALLGRPLPAKDSAIEMNVRLRLGGWSRRLWTCLEAVLAREMWIGFSDGLLPVADILKRKDQARENIFHDYHHIWEAGNPLSKPLWKLRCLHWADAPKQDIMDEPALTGQLMPKQSRVLRAWLAVQFRDLRMSPDEPVVLAGLLGMDVKEILATGNIEDHKVTALRMAKLLDQIDITPGLGIPAGIIFLPSPFLVMEGVAEVQGYGWAPMTWLRRQIHPFPMYPSLSNTARLGKRGLFVKFPALELHITDSNWRPHRTRFWVPVKRNLTVWYKIQLQKTEEECEQFWADNICLDNDENSRQPCIILSNDDPQGFNDIGLLVKRTGQLCDGRIRMVEALCRVKVRQEQNSDTVGRLVDKFRKNEQQFVFGDCTGTQEWCVVGRIRQQES